MRSRRSPGTGAAAAACARVTQRRAPAAFVPLPVEALAKYYKTSSSLPRRLQGAETPAAAGPSPPRPSPSFLPAPFQAAAYASGFRRSPGTGSRERQSLGQVCGCKGRKEKGTEGWDTHPALSYTSGWREEESRDRGLLGCPRCRAVPSSTSLLRWQILEDTF